MFSRNALLNRNCVQLKRHWIGEMLSTEQYRHWTENAKAMIKNVHAYKRCTPEKELNGKGTEQKIHWKHYEKRNGDNYEYHNKKDYGSLIQYLKRKKRYVQRLFVQSWKQVITKDICLPYYCSIYMFPSQEDDILSKSVQTMLLLI